jgi:preprotein translocase subunit SecA
MDCRVEITKTMKKIVFEINRIEADMSALSDSSSLNRSARFTSTITTNPNGSLEDLH